MKTSFFAAILVGLLLASPSLGAPANLSGIRDLLEKGRTQAALKELTALTEKDGEDYEAWALQAEAKLGMKDLDGAELAISNAIDLVEALTKKAGEGAQTKKLDRRAAAFWLVLGRVSFDRGEKAYLSRASASEIKSWYADAEMKFKDALRLDADNPETLWRIGWAKEWQEYPGKAKEFYRLQIEKFPKDAAGYRRLGAMLSTEANGVGSGTGEDAKKVRQEALDLFAEGRRKAGPDAESLYLTGLALEWNRAKDEAKASYQAAIKADPDLAKVWKRLNKIGVTAKTLLPLAMEVLAKKPGNPTATMWASFFLNEQRKFEEALNLGLKSLKVHREHGGVYLQTFTAAKSLLRSDAGTAVEAFKLIHECYPWYPDAANNVGLFYRDRGNYAESLKWYVLAMERAPLSQDILNDTALIYLFHTTGETQKKCLPILEKVYDLVHEEEQKPERGYWDTLENLCKYYYEVEKDLEKVIRYGTMRYETTDGVAPYNSSPKAQHYKTLAEKELGR